MNGRALSIVRGACFTIALFVCSGCIMLFDPIPPIDRNGEYFHLVRHYPHHEFCLLGGCLAFTDDEMSMFFRGPFSIFLGRPLRFVERFGICPVLDVLWLPEDFVRDLWLKSDESIRKNGYYVQVMDVWGRPVRDIRVDCYPNRHLITIPVLKGCRTDGSCYGRTDCNGELYVPYDSTTVEGVSACASAESVQGKYHSVPYETGMLRLSLADSLCMGSPTGLECIRPADIFPKRNASRTVRIVLMPEAGGFGNDPTRWQFVPNPDLPLKSRSGSEEQYSKAVNLDDP